MEDTKFFTRNYRRLKDWIRFRYQISNTYDSFLIREIDAKPSECILDLGSGNGRFSAAMATSGARVVALDINKAMLREVLKMIKSIRIGVDLVLADAQRLPLREGAFDKVLCAQSLWYIPFYSIVVREIFRILKRKGSIVFDYLTPFNWRFLLNGIIFKITPKSLRPKLAKLVKKDLMPVYIRTKGRILTPFRLQNMDIYSLQRGKLHKGNAMFASRLIVRSTITKRQNNMRKDL